MGDVLEYDESDDEDVSGFVWPVTPFKCKYVRALPYITWAPLPTPTLFKGLGLGKRGLEI